MTGPGGDQRCGVEVGLQGTSLVAQMVKSPPATWETGFHPWVGKIPWRRAWQPSPVFLPGQEPGGLQSMRSQRVRHD